MTRTRKALAVVGTAGLAVLLASAVLAPPRALRLRQPDWRPPGAVVRGVFHVHTTRSDGTGTVEEVAGAAARAGLQFVVFTDHGDATRPPEPPRYLSGVLCVDGVEISTSGGHYAVVGLPASPYPLAGEPRDVVEDVARLGGFGVVTHPYSAKPGLSWTGWDTAFDAIEWANADSEWRDESAGRLARALVTYPFRSAETLAWLLDGHEALQRWDRLATSRRVVALAGADAHARFGSPGRSDPYEGRALLRLPSYESSFRTFSLHVSLPAALSGRAADDGWALVEAIRAGHLHTVVDARAAPAAFEFAAHAGDETAAEGDGLPNAGPVVFRVRSNAPVYSDVILFRDGREVHRVTRQSLVYATDKPGTYRAEVRLGGGSRRQVPWIVSNAIVLGTTPPRGAGPEPVVETVQALSPARWKSERDPRSGGEVHATPGGVMLKFRLARGAPAGQYSAIAAPVSIPPGADAIAFDVMAERPMRVSVQVRVPEGDEGERWQRSVYAEPSSRLVVVPIAQMTPAGTTRTPTPRAGAVTSLLFVVDTINTAPGTSGAIAFADVRLVKLRQP
ncbi:MAG: hypothetical protein EHM24_01750 [Acidobacteria bacterium]|nr:MAG: hypothetical protein EHM24_01750 [Acidobacteriota bacterium]